MPAHYADYVPAIQYTHLSQFGAPISDQPAQSSEPEDHAAANNPLPPLPNPLVPYHTDPDSLGLFRVYATRPTLFPQDRTIKSISDAPTFETHDSTTQTIGVEANSRLHVPDMVLTHEDLFSAFSSPTAGLLMCWQYSGSNEKLAAELNRLAGFTSDPLFNPRESGHFSHECE